MRKVLVVGVLACLCSFAFADAPDQYVNTSWTGSFTNGFGKLTTEKWQIVQGKGSLIIIEKSQIGFTTTTFEFPAKVVDGILEFCNPDGVRWASLDADGNLAVAYSGNSMIMKPSN